MKKIIAILILKLSTALAMFGGWLDRGTARAYFEKEIAKYGHTITTAEVIENGKDGIIIKGLRYPLEIVATDESNLDMTRDEDGNQYGYPGLSGVVDAMSRRMHGHLDDWGMNPPAAVEAHERVSKLKGIRTTYHDPEIEQAAQKEIEYEEKQNKLLEDHSTRKK